MTSLRQRVPRALASLAKSGILVPQALLGPEVGLGRVELSGERAQHVRGMVVQEQTLGARLGLDTLSQCDFW